MEPVDYGGAFLDGVGVVAGMVWAVFVQSPWLLVLFFLVIAGTLYLRHHSDALRATASAGAQGLPRS